MSAGSMLGRRNAAARLSAQLSGYGRELHRFFFNRLRNAQDARDLTQEVYLRLLRSDCAQSVKDLRAYLYRVATHVVYEHLHRERQRHVAVDMPSLVRRADEDMHRPDELYEHLSSRQELQALLDSLSPARRAILVMHLAEGLSCAEIAEELRLSKHTVKKYLTRTISTLRTQAWKARAGRSAP